jgi:hypothetical protein
MFNFFFSFCLFHFRTTSVAKVTPRSQENGWVIVFCLGAEEKKSRSERIKPYQLYEAKNVVFFVVMRKR